MKLVTDVGLVIFCWGDDNNDKNTIKRLKEMGLHAVIYDKLDQYITKEVKVCIKCKLLLYADKIFYEVCEHRH